MNNDRFKFRVWTDGKMYYDANMFIDAHTGLVHSYGYDLESVDAYTLMQCTGLKDKNGKLIYEGDILKHPDRRISTVAWIEDNYAFTMDLYQWVSDQEGDCSGVEKVEVIGNKYENPELLK